jgi:hypothetical protein
MDPRYEVYKMCRKVLEKRYEDETTRSLYDQLREMIDRDIPEFSKRYDSEIQKIFTQEQQEFICWQIGEWYVNWRQHILDGCNPGQHRLGYAKEQLKSMICGDGYE